MKKSTTMEKSEFLKLNQFIGLLGVFIYNVISTGGLGKYL